MKVFKLPDLGEGLPDAEIVEWLVEEGDEVKTDQPMVSMETAKAVVEVPSPYTGKIVKFHGQAGDVIETHAPLCEFEVEGEEGADPGDAQQAAEDATPPTPQEEKSAPAPAADTADETAADDEGEREDSGTVVGAMEASDEKVTSGMQTVGGKKVTPAVRALAKKLKVDLAQVDGSGNGGVVTAKDVKQAAKDGSAKIGQKKAEPATSLHEKKAEPAQKKREPKTAPPPQPKAPPSGEWEPVRGTRRTMARIMSESHKSVVPTTLMDDADIHAWTHGQDITVRLIRSLWAGAQAEPGLNAWYDGEQGLRAVHKGMDVGMAVDTEDGLFVAALRDVHSKSPSEVRADINNLRDNVKNRSIPPEDLKDYTIVLSNFGVFAGRYATPVITPPCVTIVAAGKLRNEVVPVLGGFEVHRTIPLSLTFDHRASTGGEAARFLKAMIEDLNLPE